MAKDKHSVDRPAQYKALRDAGFSSKDATRLKGASPEKVREAIRTKQMPEKVTHKITMGPTAPKSSKGYRPPTEPKQRQPHARGVEYKDVRDHEKAYLSRYSWVVSYRHKRSDEKHFITITSSRDMYGYQVLAEAVTILEANGDNKYNLKLIAWSSVAIEYAIYNEDGF